MEPVEVLDWKGTRYVPLRDAARQVNGAVEWDNSQKRATVMVDGRQAQFSMAESTVQTDQGMIDVGAPAMVKDDVLYVSEAFFAQVFGKQIDLA